VRLSPLKNPQGEHCISDDLALGLVAGVVRHSLQALIDCGFRRLNLAAKFLGTMFYKHFLVQQLPVVILQMSVRHGTSERDEPALTSS